MNHNNQRNPELDPLMQEAFNWIVRLTSGSATREDAHAFEQWRAQGPDHAAAFREVAAFRKATRAMNLPYPTSTPSNVTSIGSRARPVLMDRRAMLVGGGAIAASAAAFMVAQPPLGLWPSFAELTADHRTGLGERRTLRLAGGAVVEMNARSALSLLANDQGVDLVTGEAFVAVARSATDFVIEAGGERVSSRSGTFNVRTSARESCVTCLTGSVLHERDGEHRLLRPGDQLVASPDGRARLERVDASRASGWRRGLLIFRDTPLAEALEDINRYRNGKIILAHDSLATRPVNGIFHTDQVDNAVAQIQQLLHLKVTHLPGGVILLG